MKTSEKIDRDGPASVINGKTVYMARLIMKPADDETVVYVNGDPLDNRRGNLLVVKTRDLSTGPRSATA